MDGGISQVHLEGNLYLLIFLLQYEEYYTYSLRVGGTLQALKILLLLRSRWKNPPILHLEIYLYIG
jgi:hypothetical protein